MRPTEPTVAAIVREQTGAAWSRARDLCSEGRVTVDGERCLDSALRVPPGAVVVVDERAAKLRPGALPESAIAYLDRDVVVVDKPAGMLSVAYEPGDKDTLVDCTRALLRRMRGRGFDRGLGVVHRLDKDTSGVMVFARTAEAKRLLVGERVYIRDYAGPKIESPRPMLHARVLGFVHPRTGQRMSFEREAPDDFRAMVESLRPTRG